MEQISPSRDEHVVASAAGDPPEATSPQLEDTAGCLPRRDATTTTTTPPLVAPPILQHDLITSPLEQAWSEDDNYWAVMKATEERVIMQISSTNEQVQVQLAETTLQINTLITAAVHQLKCLLSHQEPKHIYGNEPLPSNEAPTSYETSTAENKDQCTLLLGKGQEWLDEVADEPSSSISRAVVDAAADKTNDETTRSSDDPFLPDVMQALEDRLLKLMALSTEQFQTQLTAVMQRIATLRTVVHQLQRLLSLSQPTPPLPKEPFYPTTLEQIDSEQRKQLSNDDPSYLLVNGQVWNGEEEFQKSFNNRSHTDVRNDPPKISEFSEMQEPHSDEPLSTMATMPSSINDPGSYLLVNGVVWTGEDDIDEPSTGTSQGEVLTVADRENDRPTAKAPMEPEPTPRPAKGGSDAWEDRVLKLMSLSKEELQSQMAAMTQKVAILKIMMHQLESLLGQQSQGSMGNPPPPPQPFYPNTLEELDLHLEQRNQLENDNESCLLVNGEVWKGEDDFEKLWKIRSHADLPKDPSKRVDLAGNKELPLDEPLSTVATTTTLSNNDPGSFPLVNGQVWTGEVANLNQTVEPDLQKDPTSMSGLPSNVEPVSDEPIPTVAQSNKQGSYLLINGQVWPGEDVDEPSSTSNVFTIAVNENRTKKNLPNQDRLLNEPIAMGPMTMHTNSRFQVKEERVFKVMNRSTEQLQLQLAAVMQQVGNLTITMHRLNCHLLQQRQKSQSIMKDSPAQYSATFDQPDPEQRGDLGNDEGSSLIVNGQVWNGEDEFEEQWRNRHTDQAN